MTITCLLVLALLLQAPAPLPAGTYIQAELKKEINRRAKPGQTVILTVSDDVKGSDGAVLIPAGAKLTGKIAIAHRREKGGPSELSFIVDSAEWKNGSMPLHAVIERLVALASASSETCLPNLNRGGPSSCTGGGANLQTPPPDCSVTQAAGENAIACTKRDLELGPGSLLLLHNLSAGKS